MDSFSLVNYLGPVDVENVEAINIIEDGKAPVKLKPPEKIPAIIIKTLDTILPPREFEEDGINWIQFVCKGSADRKQVLSRFLVKRLNRNPYCNLNKVLSLRDLLDEKLIQRQARQNGICQCFDETIRQTTIICLERGLLLLRVRDEFRMTLHACMTLFEQSTDNGFKNSRKQESDKDDLVARMSSLEVELASLASEAARLRNEIREKQRTVEREARTRQRLARDRADTINKANLQLKRQIEAILSNKENQK